MLSWKRVLSLTTVLSLMAFLAWAAEGQREGRAGGERRAVDPAVRAKAVNVVAKFIAKDAGLAGDKAEKFVAAYAAEREAATKRRAEAMKGGFDRETFTKLTEQDRKGMNAVLEANLSAEGAKKASGYGLDALEGSVRALLEAKVDEAKIEQAMPILAKYAKASAEMRAKMGEGGSREDMQAKDKELRAATVKELAPVIGEEAAKKWQEMRFGFGMGGGRRGGGAGAP